jgi:hypothetical protein
MFGRPSESEDKKENQLCCATPVQPKEVHNRPPTKVIDIAHHHRHLCYHLHRPMPLFPLTLELPLSLQDNPPITLKNPCSSANQFQQSKKKPEESAAS